MRASARVRARELVFTEAPLVPVPSRAVSIQATKCAFAEGVVAAAMHPVDGLVLRSTLTGGGSAAQAARVRLFHLPSMMRTAFGAAAGGAAFALAYAVLVHALDTRGSPEQTFLAAGFASLLSTCVDAPMRAAGAGMRMGTELDTRLAVTAALRDVPNDAVEFSSYEALRNTLGAAPHERLLAGALAGSFTSLVTSPLECTLAHMLAHRNARTIPQAMRALWRAGGIRALYAGSGGRCSREALATSLFFVLYDDNDD